MNRIKLIYNRFSKINVGLKMTIAFLISCILIFSTIIMVINYTIANKFADYDRQLVQSSSEIIDQVNPDNKDLLKAQLKERLIHLVGNTKKDITRTAVMILVIGLVITMSLFTFISQLLSNFFSYPLKKIREFATALGKGDLHKDYELDLGTPVDCSKYKQCNNQECPSFGKTAYCWIEAGSFSVTPTCPRALGLKGPDTDCRTCDLYGCHNEVQEVNSLLASIKMNLSLMVKDLKAKAEDLSSATTELDQTTEEMKQTAEDVSEKNFRTSEELVLITENIKLMANSALEINENISEIAKVSELARERAKEGENSVKESVDSIQKIAENSEKIENFLKIITAIAKQSNLLSLNAAIEAAKAGEAGKGFAVVAEQMRNLAERSGKSAKEIQHLINSSSADVKAGENIIEATGRVLFKIIENINTTSTKVDKVIININKQNQITHQIKDSAENITKTAEINAAAVHELSQTMNQTQKTVSELSLMSDDLHGRMDIFVTD